MMNKIFLCNIIFFMQVTFCFAQHKVRIEYFFEVELNKKVNYNINLPYKAKVKDQMVKRSESALFNVYDFIPKKKSEGLDFGIKINLNSLDKVLNDYCLSDCDLKQIVKDKLCQITYKDEKQSSTYYVIILNQQEINNQAICLEYYVYGERKKMDKLLPKLLHSFSNITINDYY